MQRTNIREDLYKIKKGIECLLYLQKAQAIVDEQNPLLEKEITKQKTKFINSTLKLLKEKD